MNRAYLHYGLRQFFSRGDDRSARRLRGAAIAMGLSIVPLIASIEVADGMIDGITRRYIEVGTYHLQARYYGTSTPEGVEEALKKTLQVPGVVLAFEAQQGLGLAHSPSGRSGVMIRSVPGDLYDRDEGLQRYLTLESGVFGFGMGEGAMLSREVAAELNVSVGDPVKVMTPRSLGTDRFIVRQTAFVVEGVFTTGYSDLDGVMVFISEPKGRAMLREPGATYLAIKVADPYSDLETLRREISRVLPADWYVFSWYELEEAMYRTFRTTRNLLTFIMVLIVCVAAVNVSSSLVMLATERSKEIAMLKSAGASPAGVAVAFVAIGLCVGLIGTGLGVFLGLLVSVNINGIIQGIESVINIAVSPSGIGSIRILDPGYYLERIPVDVRFREIALVGILGLAVSVLSAWVPARRAGRLRPVEVIRGR